MYCLDRFHMKSKKKNLTHIKRYVVTRFYHVIVVGVGAGEFLFHLIFYSFHCFHVARFHSLSGSLFRQRIITIIRNNNCTLEVGTL